MQFILGTVQFGSAYGVSNVTGKIPETEVKKILDFSWNNGISCLDTAPAYNDSERLIGINIEKKDWKIQTKTPFFEAKIISNIEVNFLTKMFRSSLLNLNRNKIESLMIHNCDDLFKPGGYKIINTLESLKQEGYISKVGVSVYSKSQIDKILDSFPVDIIQLPVSILDQRLIRDGSLEKIKRYGVETHARSIFLQGLLLMSNESIPNYFLPITSILNKFKEKSAELSISKLELALSFISNIESIDFALIGVNSLTELKQILGSKIIKLDLDNYSELSVNNDKFMNPSNWDIN